MVQMDVLCFSFSLDGKRILPLEWGGKEGALFVGVIIELGQWEYRREGLRDRGTGGQGDRGTEGQNYETEL